MKKLTTLLILGLMLFVFSGCFGFLGRISKGTSAGTGVLSSTSQEKETSIIVGFDLLEDKRPKKDISYMTSVSEKVSDKILKTLRNIRLFDEIHFPASEDDSIIISGEIRKFHWESFDTMISYIPGLNVLPFFGLPSTRVHSEVDIYLEFKNNKTNEAILGFIESYTKDKKYNIYNFKSDRADEDLANCFDIVLKRIKRKIDLNKNKILEVVDLVSTKISKPTQDKKPKESPKATDLKEKEEEKKEKKEKKEKEEEEEEEEITEE